MNALHILRCTTALTRMSAWVPPNLHLGAKAAPGLPGKLIIRLINAIADLVGMGQRMIKVVFLENYCVSAAEILIPATDVSSDLHCGQGGQRHRQYEVTMNGVRPSAPGRRQCEISESGLE